MWPPLIIDFLAGLTFRGQLLLKNWRNLLLAKFLAADLDGFLDSVTGSTRLLVGFRPKSQRFGHLPLTFSYPPPPASIA